MTGYIKLYRKLFENPIVCKDSDTIAIWIYLLLNATHKEISVIFKGKKITLQKGQLITGILSISKILKINKDKVQRTLKRFELDKQIEQQTSNKNRLISIVKWKQYQNSDNQLDKQMINKCETNDNKQECNNVINNSTLQKTDNESQNFTDEIDSSKPKANKTKIKSVFTTEDKEYKLANYLSSQIAKRLNKPLQKEKTLQKWAMEFERLSRIDGNDIDEIKDVLIFSQKDLFWQTNILSANKFRKQYLLLLSKMKKEENT